MIFFKENKKPFTAIKTTTKHENLSQRYILKSPSSLHNREASRKLHMQLEIPSCLGYGPVSSKV